MLDAEYIKAAEHRARRFSGAYTGTSGTLAADSLRMINERKELMATIADLESRNAELRDAVQSRMASTPADDPKLQGYTPMAASLAGCRPAQEAAARCFDTATDSPTEIADSDTPAVPEDWILQGHNELKGKRAADGWRRAVESAKDARLEQERLRGDSLLKDDGVRPGSREFLAVLDELRNLHLAKTLDYGVDEDALSNIRQSADVLNIDAWAGCILRISDKMHRLRAYFRRGKCEFDGIEDTLKDIACYAAIALVLYREAEGNQGP